MASRTSGQRTLADIDPAALPVGAELSYLGTMVRQHAYKPRPLAGMWATPPFLHNGSVPSISDLLGPAERRPTTFQTGSREYDPKKLGLADESGSWSFDTSLPAESPARSSHDRAARADFSCT
jgi:hypothetical protein